jgi:hypothetical protein
MFGVPLGKLLDYIVSKRGIKANPKKIDAIWQICKPECLLDVQKLTRCVAALGRFIPKLWEKAMPLYRLLRKTPMFEWTEEADTTFVAHKRVVARTTLLA